MDRKAPAVPLRSGIQGRRPTNHEPTWLSSGHDPHSICRPNRSSTFQLGSGRSWQCAAPLGEARHDPICLMPSVDSLEGRLPITGACFTAERKSVPSLVGRGSCA